MLSDLEFRLGVCPVCEEVFEINGELPICENCLTRLDRWAPEEAEMERLSLAA
jgi:predicted amidophosphoribosyltransferase